MSAPTTAVKPTAAGDVVLITGTSRGIGLSLVEKFALAGAKVFATVRDPAKADALNALVKKLAGSSVTVVALDVNNSKSVEALPKAVSDAKLDRLDVLINNAGYMSPQGLNEKLDNVSRAVWSETLITNVVGTWDVTRVMMPLLRKSAAPRIVNITSIAGSIGFTVSATLFNGQMGSYRASKAAINELSATQAAEYNGATVAGTSKAPLVTVLAIHPGMVETDMFSTFKDVAGMPKPITPDQSAEAMAALVTAAKAKPNPKAVFVSYDGSTLPW